MGPRAAARGNEGSTTGTFQYMTLQWGREQLLAEICPSSTPRTTIHWLQWGREQLLAEMARANRKGTTRGASMGPRAAARGNHKAGPRIGTLPKLQWGREQLLAEMHTSATKRTAIAGFNGAASSCSRKS